MIGMTLEQKDFFSYQVDLRRTDVYEQSNPLIGTRERVDFSFVRDEVNDRYCYDGNSSIVPAVIMKMMFLLFHDNVASERELTRIIWERLLHVVSRVRA